MHFTSDISLARISLFMVDGGVAEYRRQGYKVDSVENMRFMVFTVPHALGISITMA